MAKLTLKRDSFKGNPVLEIQIDGEFAFSAGWRKWQAIMQAIDQDASEVRRFIVECGKPVVDVGNLDVSTLTAADRSKLLAALTAGAVAKPAAVKRGRR